MDSVDKDQTARYVQSDLDVHCPQKPLVSSTVRKELYYGAKFDTMLVFYYYTYLLDHFFFPNFSFSAM